MFRYQNNAFRILGLTADASMKEIMQRVNEVKVKKSLGIDFSYDFDFAWIGDIDRSEQNVINALQRLENPVNRLKEEIFWFWRDTDTDEEAINHLIKGDRQAAHLLWKTKTPDERPNESTISAYVNQMILSHSSVIGKELAFKYNGNKEFIENVNFCEKCNLDIDKEYNFCIYCGSKLKSREKKVSSNTPLSDRHWTNWQFAFNRISLIANEDVFWNRIYEKAERINDPLLSTRKVDEIRDEFFADIINPNFRFIAQSLFNKDYERTKKHASLLNGSSLSYEVLRKGFNDTLASQTALIKRHCANAKKEVSDFEKIHIKPIKVIVNIYVKLEEKVNEPIKEGNLVDFNCISDFGLVRDSLAGDVKNIAIILNNLLIGDKTIVGEKREWGFKKAHEMIKKAHEYASSQYTKQKFEKDKEVIESNMEMEQIEGGYDEIPSKQSTSGQTSSQQSSSQEKRYKRAPQKSASGSNWKQSAGWIIFFIVMIIVANLPDDSSKKTSSSSKSTPSYSSQSSSYGPTAYQLKSQIEDLDETIKQREDELKVLQDKMDPKQEAIDALKIKINELETRYNNTWFGKDKIADEYNQAVENHNAILEAYQKDYIRYQTLYSSYEQEFSKRNSLVEQYNKKIQ